MAALALLPKMAEMATIAVSVLMEMQFQFQVLPEKTKKAPRRESPSSPCEHIHPPSIHPGLLDTPPG